MESAEQAQFLAECFPYLDSVQINELLKEGDLIQAIRSLEVPVEPLTFNLPPLQIRLPKQSNKVLRYMPETSKTLVSLATLFPHFDPVSIENALAAHDGDISKTADHLSTHSDHLDVSVRSRDGNALAQLSRLFPDTDQSDLLAVYYRCSFDITRTVDALLQPSRMSTQAWTEPPVLIPDAIRYILTPISTSTSITRVSTSTREDPRVLREEATGLAIRRNGLFERAGNEFKRGDLTGRGTASYYAEQARVLDSQMREKHKLAAQAQIRHNSTLHSNDPDVIDLHGLYVTEAKECMVECMGRRDRKGWLRVITGAGNHSQGVGKLAPAILAMVRAMGWRVDVEKSGNGWFFCKMGT